MNGWERIAFVLGTIACALAFAIGYDSKTSNVTHDVPVWLVDHAREKGSDDYFWREFWLTSGYSRLDEMKDCAEGTTEGSFYPSVYNEAPRVSLSCERSTWARASEGLTYAFWTAFILYIIVAVLKWIAAGFRKPKVPERS